nr:MAG TPA: Interleukin-13, Interleukin-13 receptor subunit alpha-2, receptor, decoy, decoy receptor [Caudoviricetes sp.]
MGVKSCVLFICFVLIAGKKWRKYKKMQEMASNLSRNKLSFE